jgi:hypothetical protein
MKPLSLFVQVQTLASVGKGGQRNRRFLNHQANIDKWS